VNLPGDVHDAALVRIGELAVVCATVDRREDATVSTRRRSSSGLDSIRRLCSQILLILQAALLSL
jgi:hypothetical protein